MSRISCDTTNVANILSVTINKSIGIEGPNMEDIYLSEATGLNFNLKTGELIPLGDLFADNCDYKDVVNREVSDYLLRNNIDRGDAGAADDMMRNRIKLASLFEGIKDNQQYVICDEDICLIIDYHTPGFDIGFYFLLLPLDSSNPDYAKNLALFERFETGDDSLYDGAIARSKELRHLNYRPMKNQIMYGQASDVGLSYQDVQLSLFLECPRDVANADLKARFEENYNQGIPRVQKHITEKKKKYPDKALMLGYTYSVQRMGKYLAEAESQSVYASSSGDTGISDSHSTYNIYDENTGCKISLKDLFKEGFDYENCLLNVFKDNIKRNNTAPRTDQEILKTIRNGNFILQSTGLDMIGSSQAGIDDDYYSVTYKEIGFDNLVIFDSVR